MLLNAIHFAGSDFMLEAADLVPSLANALIDCAMPGQDASDAVAYVREWWPVSGNPQDCRDYLAQYGAWDADQLADHEKNLDRLVWLTGCALGEHREAHFSTY